MMAAKPILFAVDAPGSPVEDYRCGITIRTGQTNEIAEGQIPNRYSGDRNKLMTEQSKYRSKSGTALFGTGGRNNTLLIFSFSARFTSLIHEVHDMWPATLIELGGMSRYHPFVLLIQLAE